jgi:hypothetical protein
VDERTNNIKMDHGETELEAVDSTQRTLGLLYPAHGISLPFFTLKKKAVPLHATVALGGERRYNSYSFSISALDGGEWSASRPVRALLPGKRPTIPIVQEAGWAPEPVWTQRLEEKSFCLCRRSNLDRPVVQPVARHYTD